MIDRCYDAFSQMFDGLIVACEKRRALAEERNKKNAANTLEYTEESKAV